MATKHEEFHAYVKSVVAHMPGWVYRQSANESKVEGSGDLAGQTFTELRMGARVHFGNTNAEISFTRDDHRKKFTVNAETYRYVKHDRVWLPDSFKASAGFSQGRDPKQVACAVLAKVADAAIKAGAELDKREQEANEERSKATAAIKALNASKLLSRPIEALRDHDREAHFYTKVGTHGGRVTQFGDVYLDRISVDAQTAIRIMKILAEAKGAE